MPDLDLTVKILEYLKKNPDATQRELVEELGISLGKVNFLISALVKKGLVKLKRFTLSGRKRGYLYLLTLEGIRTKTELTRSFLKIKLKEYETIKKEIDDCRAMLESEKEPCKAQYADTLTNLKKKSIRM